MLKRIGTNARREIENMLEMQVNLQAVGKGTQGMERQ